MSAAAWLSAYLGAGFALLAWVAWIDRHDARSAFWMALLWPFVLAAIPFVLLAWAGKKRGWRVGAGMRRDLSAFGVRRPDLPAIGRAVRIFWFEMRVWRRSQ